jgi:prepilin-type N-terminal cleavage/methylation domain-containing protein
MTTLPGKQSQRGFTIVELMIATLIFSMVVILITIGVLSFTRAYYKGVNQSTTQNTARLIIEDIAQAIQFSGGDIQPVLTPSGNSEGVCIGGNVRYSFVRHKQLMDSGTLGPNQTRHALMRDKGASCAGGAALDVENNSQTTACINAGNCTELLDPRTRLAKMSVAPVAGTTDMFKVTIRIVYGDDDLLVNPTGDDATCDLGMKGTEYCAQSELTTIVKKRITQ